MQRLSFDEMRDRLISETATLAPMLLTKAKKIGYICPVCGNGGGANGTGIIPRKKGTTEANFYCGVCGTSYDIIHIIEKVHNLDYPQALKKGYELYPVAIATKKKITVFIVGKFFFNLIIIISPHERHLYYTTNCLLSTK